MPAKVFWVQGPWRGRLGNLPRPRGGDWLGDDTAAWRAAGIDTAVSLLEPEEEAQLVLEGEAGSAASSGLDFRVFPIPDRAGRSLRTIAVDGFNGVTLHRLLAGKDQQSPLCPVDNRMPRHGRGTEHHAFEC